MRYLQLLSALLVGGVLGWSLRAPPLPDLSVTDRPGVGLPVVKLAQKMPEVVQHRAQERQVHAEAWPVAPLLRLLDEGRYEEALSWYQGVSALGDTTVARRYKALIVDYAERLDIEEAQRLLALLVADDLLDVESRLHLALLYRKQGDYYTQLELLFNSKSIVTSSEQLSDIERRIRNAVVEALSGFGPLERLGETIRLYQFLIQHEAAYTPYYIELAKVQIDDGQLLTARATLDVVVNDLAVGEVAGALLAKIDQLERTQSSQGVALTPLGEHYLVSARLNGQYDVELLIDTGASLTVLSPQAAQGLALLERSMMGRQQLATANGNTEATLYRLDRLAIGEFYIDAPTIAVVDNLNLAGADGLLGMNFLRNFEFRIDQQNNQLILRLNSE